jgi:beta-lactamase class A
MKRIFLILFFSPLFLLAQKTDRKLQQKVESLIQGFNGDIGIYIKNLKTGKVVQINADTIYPTASIVKIPILIGIVDKINKSELSYHQNLIYADSLLYAGEDILGSFKAGEKIELSKVVMLMLTTSDNTASLWLQKLAGTGTRINEILDSNGLQNTRVNSRTAGREENRNKYGWGQTTPKEMSTILEKLYEGKIINDSLSKKMIRLLGRNYWDEEALSEIPSTIFVASKSGAVDASRSETLLVMAKQPYIFTIITKNNKDRSWETNNEAWVLTRKLSRLLYAYFAK